MAIGATFRSGLRSTTNATSYTASTTFTPAAFSLLLAWIIPNGQSTSPPTVSGHGLTWTKIQSVVVSGLLCELWAAYAGAAPSSGAVGISGYGVAGTGCSIDEIEVTGALIHSDITQAFAQKPTNNGTGTTGTVTLAAALDANSRGFSFFGHGANELTTPRTNWSELNDGSYATPAFGAESQWRSDAFETTATATWTTSIAWIGIAVEVKAAYPPYNRLVMNRIANQRSSMY